MTEKELQAMSAKKCATVCQTTKDTYPC